MCARVCMRVCACKCVRVLLKRAPLVFLVPVLVLVLVLVLVWRC